MLRRINDENKKTKEVLDKIDRGEFKKEKRVDTGLHRNKVENEDDGEEDEEEEEEEATTSSVPPPAETTSKSRVSFSGSWATDKAEDITWATSMEQKRSGVTKKSSVTPIFDSILDFRYPIVVFNPNALSKPTQNPAGCRFCHEQFLFHIISIQSICSPICI